MCELITEAFHPKVTTEVIGEADTPEKVPETSKEAFFVKAVQELCHSKTPPQKREKRRSWTRRES